MKMQSSTYMLLSCEYNFAPASCVDATSLVSCTIDKDNIRRDGKRGLMLFASVERIGREKPQHYKANFTWQIKMTFTQPLDDEDDIKHYVELAKYVIIRKSALLAYQLTDQTFRVADIFPPYESADEDNEA